MPAPDRKIPAYVDRTRLCELLDIADRTLDNWISKGFPKPGRYGKWCWAKVERHMDPDGEDAVASTGLDHQAEEIRNASKNYGATRQ